MRDVARAAHRHVRTGATLLAELLVPPLCEGCGGRVTPPALLCATCFDALGGSRPEGPILDRLPLRAGTGSPALPLIAALPYDRPVARRLVRRFKYRGVRELAGPLGGLTAAAWRAAGPRETPVWLVPVPSAPERVRLRGYNPAALLARAVGRALSLPVLELGRRRPARRSQTKLSPSARAANIADAFAPGGATPRGSIVLVDDVVTTGATLVTLAGALSAEGLRVLAALTAFRTPRPTAAAGGEETPNSRARAATSIAGARRRLFRRTATHHVS